MKIAVEVSEDAMDRACGFVRLNGGENAVLDIAIVDAESNELYGLMFQTIYELAEVQREAESETPNTHMIKAALRSLLETYSTVLDELESTGTLAVLDSSESECSPSEENSE